MGNGTTKPVENPLEKEFTLNENDKFIGFINKTNICYANSVTQCLLNCRDFKASILNIPTALVNFSSNFFSLKMKIQ